MAATDRPETAEERTARYARQLASQAVTVTPRRCVCEWCSTAPPRPNRMLVNFADMPEPKL